MISRRDFLKVAGLGVGAALSIACAPELAQAIPYSDTLEPPAPFSTPFKTSTPRIITPTAGASRRTRLEPEPTSRPTVSYEGRKLCFVLWDHQLARFGYRPRNLYKPVPETAHLYAGVAMTVTEAWQEYWQGLLRLLNPNMNGWDFQRGWRSLVTSDRAFTNNTGAETDNFRLHDITCGGATLEMVTGIPEGPNGSRMRVYTLNMSKDPPPLPATPAGVDMTRHFFATTGSNVKLPDGSYAVYGFPQFENCIVPLVSNDKTDLIEVSRIKPVSGLQRPYNP